MKLNRRQLLKFGGMGLGLSLLQPKFLLAAGPSCTPGAKSGDILIFINFKGGVDREYVLPILHSYGNKFDWGLNGKLSLGEHISKIRPNLCPFKESAVAESGYFKNTTGASRGVNARALAPLQNYIAAGQYRTLQNVGFFSGSMSHEAAQQNLQNGRKDEGNPQRSEGVFAALANRYGFDAFQVIGIPDVDGPMVNFINGKHAMRFADSQRLSIENWDFDSLAHGQEAERDPEDSALLKMSVDTAQNSAKSNAQKAAAKTLGRLPEFLAGTKSLAQIPVPNCLKTSASITSSWFTERFPGITAAETSTALSGFNTEFAYHRNKFADALRAIVQQSKTGPVFLYIEVGGYDTHSAQRVRLDYRLAAFNEALSRFLQGLKETSGGSLFSKTKILTASEFSRSPRETESGGGTDHARGFTVDYFDGGFAANQNKSKVFGPSIGTVLNSNGQAVFSVAEATAYLDKNLLDPKISYEHLLLRTLQKFLQVDPTCNVLYGDDRSDDGMQVIRELYQGAGSHPTAFAYAEQVIQDFLSA